MRSNPFLAPQAPWTDRWKRLLGQERLAAIAPLAAVLLFLATIAAAFWYLSAQDAQRELAAARHDLEFSQQQLRLHLQEQAGELERLARAVSGGNMGAAQFAQSARALAGRWPEMRDMRWLDAQALTSLKTPMNWLRQARCMASRMPCPCQRGLVRRAACGFMCR